MKSKMISKNGKRWLAWLKFIGVTIILPLVAVGYSLYHIARLQSEIRLKEFQQQALEAQQQLFEARNAEEFICRNLERIDGKNKRNSSLKLDLQEFSREYDLDLEILLWKAGGNIFWSNFAYQERKANWQKAFKDLLMIVKKQPLNLNKKIEINLRRIFGPHFFPRFNFMHFSTSAPRLTRGDSAGKWSCSWLKMRDRRGTLVLVKPEKLNGYAILRKEAKKTSSASGSFTALAFKDEIFGDDGALTGLTAEEINRLKNGFESVHFINNHFVCKFFLDRHVSALIGIPATKINGLKLSRPAKLVLFVFVLSLLSALFVSYLIFIRERKLAIGIRKQLIMMFLLCNSMPMLILGVTGYDYLIQHRNFLEAEAFSDGITYLQSIDEMFASEFSHQLKKMDQIFLWLPEVLRKSAPNKEIVLDIIRQQDFAPFRLVLIGSHAADIGSEMGIMRDGVFVDVIEPEAAAKEPLKMVIDFLGKLGKYYLSRLNRETMSEQDLLKIELIAESLGQNKPLDMLQEFFAATGTFWQWGMGKNYFPAYIRVFSLNDGGKSDYVFFYLYNASWLQQNYFHRIRQTVNRNKWGMRIMAFDNRLNYAIPAEVLKEKFLQDFVVSLRHKSGAEHEFCRWQEQRHMLIGLKCSSLDQMRLIGLIPMEPIEQKTAAKLKLFIISGLLSLLIAFSMGMLISRSFLIPLFALNSGVEALKEQNFSYRLPDLGRDEFGQLANMFNTTLVDLEEMQVASAVEEKIFPAFVANQHCGVIEFAGRTIPAAASGSDLVDCFEIDKELVAVVIGDVAGKGIATTLVKTFAKAVMLQLSQYYAQPETILEKLAETFALTNEGQQKKFMTLQYLVINGHTGELHIANAGHCFPLVVGESSQKVRTLSLPAVPLGSGSRIKIASCRLALKEDESLILYSGGVYRNPGSGFEDFCRILAANSAADPEQVCRKSCEEVRSAISSFEDDISMVCIKRSS